jgi:OOP family OmpA-OmpF porin
MKNKLLGFITTLLVAAGLASCGTTSKNEAPPPAEPPAAAAPPPEPASPPPPPPEPPTFVLEGVHFEFDKATLTPTATSILDEAAETLQSIPATPYQISGHTDSRGSDEYNQGLSERRAKAVRDYLVAKGVAPSQLTSRGYGESRPIASNETDAGRAENRRVDIEPLN